jgi:hypothetical protein
VVSPQAIARLPQLLGRKVTTFVCAKEEGVEHASLVLGAPVHAADGRLLEAANPRFAEMLAAIVSFAQAGDAA